jgi:hypothetical protein
MKPKRSESERRERANACWRAWKQRDRAKHMFGGKNPFLTVELAYRTLDRLAQQKGEAKPTEPPTCGNPPDRNRARACEKKTVR